MLGTTMAESSLKSKMLDFVRSVFEIRPIYFNAWMRSSARNPLEPLDSVMEDGRPNICKLFVDSSCMRRSKR
jgi:hypothetical protein